ncbi:hypothetical protein KIW84_060739 [Lathyrus oleraceus]|uniref:Transposase MuDR plant domain-containing protein n=1 Tax=Pisum sativum TaxID=3888 RepID=A0A9D4W290_PEA|nr:hypothetical protein KIW84_060739 [Pisum sativum]
MMVGMFMLYISKTLIFGPSLKHGEDATMLTLCAEKSNCDVEIYIEPMLSMGEKTYMERLIEKQKGHESVEKNESAEDSESIEDSLDGIHFEDSEEERMHDFYEDIDEWLNIRVDNDESVDDADTGQRKKKVFTTVEMDKEHVIEDDYMTNELDSMTNEDSFDDKPAVIRFNKEEKLRKDFIFKVGMKFSSLKQFKKVVLEHNVLNGREVRAFKAKQLSRKVVEGDSTKKYSMIWSYDAKLRRTSKRNTFKLNIVGLPPRKTLDEEDEGKETVKEEWA